jgi:ABC-type bacteriocin/lantibiotic exporter with double-glycine peptidase domain
MKETPFYRQKNDYYCGPAIIQMTLGAFGMNITQRQAAREARTDQHKGTGVRDLVEVLKRHGLRVSAGNNKNLALLKRSLKKEAVAIICYTEPLLEWGHYAIVKKFYADRILLIDPDSRTGTTAMLAAEFKRRWKDPLFTKTIRWAAIVEPARRPKKSR